MQELSKVLKKRWDGRNTIHKVKDLIRVLRELGYKEDDRIPYEDLEYEIRMIFGCDSRTVKKYLALAVSLEHLKPAGHLIQDRRTVIVRTIQSTFPREYSSFKGYSHYVFGIRAPRLYEEILNPKYVSPAPLSEDSCLNECLSGPKNMCVTRMGGGVQDVDDGFGVLESVQEGVEGVEGEEERRRRLRVAHILLDTESVSNNENPENKTILEKETGNLKEKLDTEPQNSVSNTVSNKPTVSNNLVEKLDIEIKVCPRCGRKGHLASRYVLNSAKRRCGPYFYFGHYYGGRKRWCYLGRETPLMVINDAEG